MISINGQGWAPKGATPEYFTSRGKTMAGTGLDPAVVPGVIHAALTILERWGTMTFAQVSARAIDYAENGFPLRPRTTLSIENNLRSFVPGRPTPRCGSSRTDPPTRPAKPYEFQTWRTR